MSFDFKLDNHPAVRRHPINKKEVLLNVQGNPTPLLPDHRCIRLAGTMIGYVFPNGKLTFLVPEETLGKDLIKAAVEFVKVEFKPVTQVQAVAPRRNKESNQS